MSLGTRILFRSALCLSLVALPLESVRAQNFVAVTDTLNPIVTATINGAYTGGSWVDVDDDGLLDLVMSRKVPVYRNLGGGSFVRETGALMAQGNTLGATWSDYDNDGDIDCFMSGNVFPNGSLLYRNDGAFQFTKITTGDIGAGPTIAGWGCAFADFNNDSYTDIVVAAANGFGGVSHENRLFLNNTDGTFTRIDSTVITDSLDAHTIPTWSDYDDDGDQDLFIGSGEISQLSPDNLFRNMSVENGSWGFERITTAPIATDMLDGQVWNWIDYDNDGDLDAYQTNYAGALENRLYRNDAGAYVQMTEPDVGTIASHMFASLANNWADFDNDGDLDCLVTNDGAARNGYFVNNNDGTFTEDTVSLLVTEPGPHYGASAGDYDNDGDLDLFVQGNTATKRLWRNDLANSNHWVNIKLVGAGAGGSNRSAIGAKVRVKATVQGTSVWQRREVSAQNSFNCMNMLNVHFGLAESTTIDSLVIEWPAGGVFVATDVDADRFYTFVEGVNPTDVNLEMLDAGLGLLPSSPNPFEAATTLSFQLARTSNVQLSVFDVQGRRVRTLVDGVRAQGVHRVHWDGKDSRGRTVSSGVYWVRLDEPGSRRPSRTQTITRLR